MIKVAESFERDPGGAGSSEELLKKVYRELRQLAESRLAREMPGHTLTPTALVNETYIRLRSAGGEQSWDSKAHFFGAAAEAMRRILIDHARRKKALRRGGEFRRIDFATAELSLELTDSKAQTIIELSDSLDEFELQYSKEAFLVKLRFFAGLTMEEAAEVMEINRRTAQRYWAFAKAVLTQLMNDDGGTQ